jgi:ketosteroid isomerase-like protein
MGKTLAVLLAWFGLLAAAPEDDIRRVLDAQVAAWNRGDVREFMDGYDNSPSTTFVGATITKGHAQVLANYLKRYPSRDKMGTLQFSGHEIRPLDGDYASVVGHWHLTRAKEAGGDTGGIFTLLFHKTAQGWKVILDHTS